MHFIAHGLSGSDHQSEAGFNAAIQLSSRVGLNAASLAIKKIMHRSSFASQHAWSNDVSLDPMSRKFISTCLSND